MRTSTFIGLAASIVSAQAVYQGFNYGNLATDGSVKTQADYEAEFKAAQNLAGTSGWSSARIYTMIQGGTTDSPIEAIQAAIDTKTTLLLGMWASAGDDAFANEISALKNAIDQFGSDFADVVAGISVGSEDLYRETPTGIENGSDPGASPDTLVKYIKQVRSTISGTALSGASIGHVDTYNAWENSTVSEVADNCDWLGMDTYPYYQNTVDNSIEQAKDLFWEAYNVVKAAGGGSKEVWITETGWPTSGKTENNAVPSTKNAEIFWQEVACELEGNYNTWWFTLSDTQANDDVPYFGVLDQQLSPEPLYDLSCKKNSTSTSSTKSSTATATKTGTKGTSEATATGGSATGSGSGSGSSSLPSGGPSLPNGGNNGVPYGSGNGTAPNASGVAASTGLAGSTTTAAGGVGASATSYRAPFGQTRNSAAKAVPVGAGMLALFGLVAAL